MPTPCADVWTSDVTYRYRPAGSRPGVPITGNTSLIFWGNATRIDAERLSVAGVLWTLQSAAWPHDIGGISLVLALPLTATDLHVALPAAVVK